MQKIEISLWEIFFCSLLLQLFDWNLSLSWLPPRISKSFSSWSRSSLYYVLTSSLSILASSSYLLILANSSVMSFLLPFSVFSSRWVTYNDDGLMLIMMIMLFMQVWWLSCDYHADNNNYAEIIVIVIKVLHSEEKQMRRKCLQNRCENECEKEE